MNSLCIIFAIYSFLTSRLSSFDFSTITICDRSIFAPNQNKSLAVKNEMMLKYDHFLRLKLKILLNNLIAKCTLFLIFQKCEKIPK